MNAIREMPSAIKARAVATAPATPNRSVIGDFDGDWIAVNRHAADTVQVTLVPLQGKSPVTNVSDCPLIAEQSGLEAP